MKNIDALKPYLHFALLWLGLWLVFDYIPNTARDVIHEDIFECVSSRTEGTELAAWRRCVGGRLEDKS